MYLIFLVLNKIVILKFLENFNYLSEKNNFPKLNIYFNEDYERVFLNNEAKVAVKIRF